MKTNKEMNVFLNVNICHILNRVLKSQNVYKTILEDTTIMIGHNIESVRGGLYNIRRFNQILERKDIILGDVLPTRGGDTDNNEVKGYHFSRSIATDAKELIDIRK
jgi:hypothetical protein